MLFCWVGFEWILSVLLFVVVCFLITSDDDEKKKPRFFVFGIKQKLDLIFFFDQTDVFFVLTDASGVVTVLLNISLLA